MMYASIGIPLFPGDTSRAAHPIALTTMSMPRVFQASLTNVPGTIDDRTGADRPENFHHCREKPRLAPFVVS